MTLPEMMWIVFSGSLGLVMLVAFLIFGWCVMETVVSDIKRCMSAIRRWRKKS